MAYKTAYMHGSNVAGVRQPANWLQRVRTMFDVRRSRNDLSQLSPELLKDVGLTKQDVEDEMELPFWDVPQHWRRH